MSSHPGAVSSAYVCRVPVAVAPMAALKSRIAASTRFCLSKAMRHASTLKVQASSDTASSRPMEKGPTERIMCTMASLCAKIAASVITQAIGSRRGLLTLRSMTQALAE